MKSLWCEVGTIDGKIKVVGRQHGSQSNHVLRSYDNWRKTRVYSMQGYVLSGAYTETDTHASITLRNAGNGFALETLQCMLQC